MPENTITKIPNMENRLIFSEKKIIPYKDPQNICKKINGLIILLYFPAKWYAVVKAHPEIITRMPELVNNKISLADGTIGSLIKKK